MAAIGEASAIIGVVQIGFSLARTLNTYIGDYKDSRDSIIGLAVQLETTIIHVRELNTLVRSSEASGSVSEDSRKVAENAVTNSRRIIEKLVKLLTKADLPNDPDAIINIKPGDIDVRTLTKFYWPLIKPQVDVVNLELQSMKTEILLARSCIQSQTGATPAERAEGRDSIVALAKSRQLARRLLREAKAEEKRSAMAAPPAPPGRVRDDQGNQSYHQPPRRRSSGPYISGMYGGNSEDGRDTELMARDLRDSILEDLQRKDVERKAKEKAEEESRKLAIETYQQTVKEKLARLQEATETTQRQIKEIFGSTVDEKQVQKFLDQQKSRQMQDEFGEMLLKIGIGPQLPRNDAIEHVGVSSTESEAVKKPKRRWFFGRHSSRSSTSNGTSNTHATTNSSDRSSPDGTQFLHIAMSYDSVEGRYNYQTLENPALQHQPCGSTCDFENTLQAWQAVPRSAKQAASRWVDENFSDRIWHLHAALPIENDIPKTRRFLQKAVLGAVVHQGTTSIMLVFSSTKDYTASETDNTSATGDVRSESSHTHKEPSDGATSRIELSEADVEQMRDWLTSKGLSTSKIAELESLVVKQKELAAGAAATEPQVSTGTEDTSGPEKLVEFDSGGTGYPMPMNDRREPVNRVRFATATPDPREHRREVPGKANGTEEPYDTWYARQWDKLSPRRTERMSGNVRQDSKDNAWPQGNYPYSSGAHPWNREPYGGRPINRNDYTFELDPPFELDPYARQRRNQDGLHRTRTHNHRGTRSHYRSSRDTYNTEPNPVAPAHDLRNPYESYRTPTARDATAPTVNIYNDVYTDSRSTRGSRIFQGPADALDDDSTDYSSETRLERRRRSRSRSSSDDSSRRGERHTVRHERSGRPVRRDTDIEQYGPSKFKETIVREETRRPAKYGSRTMAEPEVVEVSVRKPREAGHTVIEREIRREPPPTSPRRARPLYEDPALEQPWAVPYGKQAYASGQATKGHIQLVEREPNPRQFYGNDGWRMGLDYGKPRCYFDTAALPIPRRLSPEPLPEDASEAEDATLNDAELAQKMLVKYTGGVTASDAAQDRVNTPNSSDRSEAVDGARRDETPVSTSPVPGVTRHNTATAEDYDSDADADAHHPRTPAHQPPSSPSSASSTRNPPIVEPQDVEPEAIGSLGHVSESAETSGQVELQRPDAHADPVGRRESGNSLSNVEPRTVLDIENEIRDLEAERRRIRAEREADRDFR